MPALSRRQISSRPKNIIPNTLKDIQEEIAHLYDRIPYRSRPRKVKLVEIIIFSLQARELLPSAQLGRFEQMIIDVTEKKIAFQMARLNELEPWRARNITLMRMLQEMAMRVIKVGQRCLREVFEDYFAYEAEGTGRQGRGKIQARKVSESLRYVRSVMEQQMPKYEDIQLQTQQGHLQEQAQVPTTTQAVAQMRIQENVEEVKQVRQSQALEEEEFFMDVNEFKDLMEGQRLTDTVLWNPFSPEMEFVTDLLERKQQQEIEYEFLYNGTATQIMPAIEQAIIFSKDNSQ